MARGAQKSFDDDDVNQHRSAAANDEISYTAVLLTQGKHRFFTVAMPSHILAETCFVDPRDENPEDGFQRHLDQKRAQDIADYIDNGPGTIPGAIVLSAQPAAALEYTRQKRTIKFKKSKKAFLIIDGQHRVFGFKKAKADLRVPVVIYNGLSRAEEARLFMDINTKQRPVPTELILDIKRLAEAENDTEGLMRDVFDKFNSDVSSPLFGILSPHERAKGKISRVTFNLALKSVWGTFEDSDANSMFTVLSAYIHAWIAGLRSAGAADNISNSILFKALMLVFPLAAQRVSDRFKSEYTHANFSKVLEPVFKKLKKSDFKSPGTSYTALSEKISDAMNSGFSLGKL
jgi:DGQHR domain-containing protein